MPSGSVSRLVVRAESHLRHTNEYPRAMEYDCSSPMDIVVYFRVRFCFFFFFLIDYFTHLFFACNIKIVTIFFVQKRV